MAKITAEQLAEECAVHGTGPNAYEVIARNYGLKPSTIRKYIHTNGIKNYDEKLVVYQKVIEEGCVPKLNSEETMTLRPISWEGLETGFSYSITNGRLNIANMKGDVRGILVIYPPELELLVLELSNLKKYMGSYPPATEKEAEQNETDNYLPANETKQVEMVPDKKALDMLIEKWPDKAKAKTEQSNGETFKPVKKTAVFYRCSDCEKVGFAYTDSQDVKCHYCGHEQQLYGVQSARVMCPNCVESYFTKVADDVNCVPCRGCKGPVDLVWNERKKIFDTVAQ